MSHDFISAGLFSKTEEGTGFYSTKSFDIILCIKSETIYVPHYSPRVNKYSQVSILHMR